MELESKCTLKLDKGKKKVRCFKFYHEELKRNLAIHEDVDHQDSSSISDFDTGVKLCGIKSNISKVTLTQALEMLDNFIKHFTLEEIKKELNKFEEKGNK